jgi:hypothetical protein
MQATYNEDILCFNSLVMYDLIPEEDAYGSNIEEPFYQFVLKIKNPSKC